MKKTGTILLASAMLLTAMPVNALSKSETVYSKLNNDGSVKNTVVSEYLKNTDEKINDKTDLKDVLNLNGTEKYTVEGSNIVWDAKGKDIYYQGKTDKELPVGLNISYKLNGKDITLDKLLGKKGKVEITLNYTNKDSHNVLVNGSYQKLYTPFIVTFGTMIKNENNSNITVSNGRVVSNGKSSIVVAIASPGLHDSLGIDSIKDFDTITLSYDTTNFELSSMYSVVTSGLIKQDDLKVFDKLDGIYSKVDTLSESSKKLVEGANKLKEGTSTVNAGIEKAYNGSKLLNDTLTAKINEAKNSAAIDEQTINYIKSTATASVSADIERQKTTIETLAVTNTQQFVNDAKNVIANVEDNSIDCTNPNEQTQEICAKYNEAKPLEALLNNPYVVALLKEVSSTTAYKTAQQVSNQVVNGTEEKAGLAETVATLVANNAKKKTVESLETVNTNVATLTEGLGKLNAGSSTLNTGVNTLAEGIAKFDNEGISKIASLVNGDVKTTQEKVEALIKLGDLYDTFTMKDANTEGETKFVLMVDAEKKVIKTETKKETKKAKENLLDKIKKMF